MGEAAEERIDHILSAEQLKTCRGCDLNESRSVAKFEGGEQKTEQASTLKTCMPHIWVRPMSNKIGAEAPMCMTRVQTTKWREQHLATDKAAAF